MLDVNNFEQLRIGLATADDIRTWSNGEVKKAGDHQLPHAAARKRTAFSARRSSARPRTGSATAASTSVSVSRASSASAAASRSRVPRSRRERMGHIELAAPVVHIWYLRGTRSWLAYLLMGTEAREELKAKQLEKVIYFAANLVTWVDEERRHTDLPNLEVELNEELADIVRTRDLDIDRRYKELEEELAKLEGEGAKDSELKARQRQVEKEVDARYATTPTPEGGPGPPRLRRVPRPARPQDHRGRDAVARASRPLRRLFPRRHGGRGHRPADRGDRPRRRGSKAARRDRARRGQAPPFGAAQAEGHQAPEDRLRFQPPRRVRPPGQRPPGHDPRRRPCHPARAAARWSSSTVAGSPRAT